MILLFDSILGGFRHYLYLKDWAWEGFRRSHPRNYEPVLVLAMWKLLLDDLNHI